MRILYISSNFENVQKQIMHYYSKKGINAEILIYRLRGRKEYYQSKDGMIEYNIKSKCHGPILFLKRLRKVSNHLLNNNSMCYELIYGNMAIEDGIICRYIKKRTGIPYIIAVRDTDLNLWFLWKLPWIRSEGIRCLLDANAIVFLSHPYREKLLSRLPSNVANIVKNKSVIIPNGVDQFWLKHKYVPRNKIQNSYSIITVARIIKRKNHTIVAEAIKKLREFGYQMTYTIIGNQEDVDIINCLKRYEFVKIFDRMPKEDLIIKYRESDIFVMPSLTESFGLVYVEAMTQGLPVIYTRNEGFDKQFENGEVGYCVDCNNVDEIAKAIIDIIDNYESISQNCINNCDRFDWNSIVDSHIELYNRVINLGSCKGLEKH